MKEENWKLPDYYKGKRVLVTGHTGFKGTWLCKILSLFGAEVTGYALKPPAAPSLFEISGISDKINSIEGDVRDFPHLKSVFEQVQPEIVLHLAAQPLVRRSYEAPVETYETNVMGTVHICECVRLFPCVKSFLNVTTDKVYENKEWAWGYRENEPLDGYDPYSNSKSCSELVTHSYKSSFFQNMDTAVSTARAGNVIGGGRLCGQSDYPGLYPGCREKRSGYHSESSFHQTLSACVGALVCIFDDCGHAGRRETIRRLLQCWPRGQGLHFHRGAGGSVLRELGRGYELGEPV